MRNKKTSIEEKLDRIMLLLEKLTQNVNEMKMEISTFKLFNFELGWLLEFKSDIRQTVITLLTLGVATAGDISKKTGRSRTRESSNLNKLVKMDYVKKWRKGRSFYYMMKPNKKE